MFQTLSLHHASHFRQVSSRYISAGLECVRDIAFLIQKCPVPPMHVKTLVMCTHKKRLTETLLMSTTTYGFKQKLVK